MRWLVIVSLTVISSSCGQNLNVNKIELDGTVRYTFSKKGSVYWLRNVYYISGDSSIHYRLKPDAYSLKSISEKCSYLDLERLNENLESEDFKKQALYYSPHFRDQEKRGGNPVHFGGDVYLDGDSTIAIVFNILGEGLLFEDVCESYIKSKVLERESLIPCEYAEDDIESPFIVLVKYESTYSLNSNQLDGLKLTPYKEKSFNIMLCE